MSSKLKNAVKAAVAAFIGALIGTANPALLEPLFRLLGF